MIKKLVKIRSAIRIFLTRIKSRFSSYDLTNYPIFLLRKSQINISNEIRINYRYAVYLLKKNKEYKFSNLNQYFFRSKYILKKLDNPITITRNMNYTEVQDEIVDKKLLVIYVDGLSSYWNEEINLLQYLLPETYNYFSNSTVYENYYGTGEWTLPNYASMLTGALQNSHGNIHSAKQKNELKNISNFPLIHEYLAREGYKTNIVSAVPYINPNFNFHFGTENFIFAKNNNSKKIIELYQYTEAELASSNITWLHFMDVHHRLGETDYSDHKVSPEIVDLLMENFRFSKNDAVNFVSRAHNLDGNLAQLFNLDSTKKYENIVLVSDHGSVRLSNAWEKCLDDARTKTTLIVKQKNQKNLRFIKEVLNHQSLIEIFCGVLNVKVPDLTEFQLKNFIVIQSIYAGKSYRARIKGLGIDFEYMGTNVRDSKPFINMRDIDNILSNKNLKDLGFTEKSNFKKILLGI